MPWSNKWPLSFTSSYPNPVHSSTPSYAFHMFHTSCTIWFEHPTDIMRSRHIMKLQAPIYAIVFVLSTSSLSCPHILNTLFTDALKLCFSLTMRDVILHPHNRADKITVLYILTSMCLLRRKDNTFWTAWQKAFATVNLLLMQCG
jgi:hypothetical protein